MLLLAGWIGVLGFLLVDRQVKRSPVREVPDLDSPLIDPADRPVSVRRGFVYSDTVGVEPNFRVTARETVEFASGWYELKDVEVWLYHQGRVAYGLVAERARYDPNRHEALARGDAHVSLRGGGVVRAAGFSFSGPDQFLVSEGAVTVAGLGWSALAERASFFAADDRMVLDGNVSVNWRGDADDAIPVMLLAPQMEYLQKHSLVRLSKGLNLLRERLSLRAVDGEVQLGGPGGGFRNVTLSGPVTVQGYFSDGSVIELQTGDTEISGMDDDRFRLATAASLIPGWVQMTLGQPDGSQQQLKTWRLSGEGSRAGFEWLEARERACLHEISVTGVSRRVQADRIRLEFRDRNPVSATGTGSVEVRSVDQWARGEVLTYSLVSNRFMLQPHPSGRVTVGSAEVDASADQVEGTEGGEIVASGKVTGTGRRVVLDETSDEPIHFAADSVTAHADHPEVALAGDARIWQGDRLLRADSLILNRESEVVVGRGQVLTTAVSGAQGDTTPVRIRSRNMEFVRPEGRTVYEGDVVLEDLRGTARAQRVIAHLDDAGRLRTVEMKGGVSFVEASTNRQVSGQRAILDAAAEVLDVWGEPVLVREPTGNQVKANHLRWQRDTATLVVLGADGQPTETLYRPEPTPIPDSSHEEGRDV